MDYGAKYQLVHSRSGKAISVSKIHAGAESDIAIYKQEITALSSFSSDGKIAVIADKGYQGSNGFNGIPTITPKKASKKLSVVDLNNNKIIGKHRVLCENFYGRLKGRYCVTSDLYRGDSTSHELHFVNCVALTNRNIEQYPLQNNDREMLLKVYAQQKEALARIARVQKRKHEQYVRRKMKRQKLNEEAIVNARIEIE